MSKATKVWINGVVIPMTGEDQVAEAIAIADGKILKVGSTDEINALVGEGTEVVDLAGKTLLPGFHDSHGHFAMAGEQFHLMANLSSPPVGTMTTIEQCLESMKAQMERTPEERMILGYGFDDTLISDKRHLTRADLDKISPDRPIFVSHVSGHLGYANSKTLENMGYGKDTPNPVGGVIQKDPVTGEPNGVLEETAAMGVVLGGNNFSTEMQLDAIRYISDLYAAQGVTSANDGGIGSIAQFERYQKAADDGLLNIRVLMHPLSFMMEQLDEVKVEHELLEMGGIKFVHDGSIQGYTAYLSKPYHVPYKGDTEYRGYPLGPKEELTKGIVECYKSGRQVLVHCNGDAAADDFLEALEEAQKQYPREDDRAVVIHGQTVREDQLDKFQEYGVSPSFFVVHSYYWGDRHVNIFLGEERAFRQNPLKSALDRGIVFTTHCDTPITPQNPLLSIWSSVNRVSSGGNVIGEAQCISPYEAVKAYTLSAAHQYFQEQEKGSLEEGKLADLVILSDNPITCDPMTIRDIQVMETIVGGKTVYTKGE